MVQFLETGRFDPIPKFRFLLQLGGRTFGSFCEVSGLKMETEAIPYREGGDAAVERPVPGITKSNPITLKRGLSQDPELMMWYSQIFSINGITSIAPDPAFRRTLTLLVQDRGGLILNSYMIVRCWPMTYTPGDFASLANEIAMEEVTLGNEGWSLIPAGGLAIATPGF